MSWAFWLRWLAVTLGGFLASLFWIEIGERPDIGLIEGMLGGATIGFAQSLVLRRHFSPAWWWGLANMLSWGLIGFSIFGATGWIAPRSLNLALRLFYGIINGAQIGFVLGVGQWLVLRLQVPNAWRWIAASTLCWSIGLAVGWIVGGILRLVTHLFLGEVVGLAVAWIVVGATTGLALIFLVDFS
ncbi:MAG TPA: hypothetical protein DDZ80_16420 [Cyanobacteria bacterium UBA8803]|nr:hypothetical protein [Cyanobacteria bacterium UBA9273]HBL59996.1 hypothetical protein [Cyanobacteria bacterium UBA8803]